MAVIKVIITEEISEIRTNCIEISANDRQSTSTQLVSCRCPFVWLSVWRQHWSFTNCIRQTATLLLVIQQSLAFTVSIIQAS